MIVQASIAAHGLSLRDAQPRPGETRLVGGAAAR
jgi:hypothetical protein